MSVVTLTEVKLHLRQTQSIDDALLQMLIDGAEDEAKQYLDRDELPRRDAPCPDCESDSDLSPSSDGADLAPTVRMGIFLLVQALYEGTDPGDIEKLRACALTLLRPYRCRLGV